MYFEHYFAANKVLRVLVRANGVKECKIILAPDFWQKRSSKEVDSDIIEGKIRARKTWQGNGPPFSSTPGKQYSCCLYFPRSVFWCLSIVHLIDKFSVNWGCDTSNHNPSVWKYIGSLAHMSIVTKRSNSAGVVTSSPSQAQGALSVGWREHTSMSPTI